jgi:hypothetical protein
VYLVGTYIYLHLGYVICYLFRIKVH